MPDIIVIGASAGGLQALLEVVRRLPADLPASLFVVVHLRPESTSNLPIILRRESLLEAVFPRNREPIRPGYLYVAPPNNHMIVEDHAVRLIDGPQENGVRPAIDPLFRSAAEMFGPSVVGVILSGSLDDGTAGLAAIKVRGGITIVQDPEEAEFSSMPRSAMENLTVDHVLPAALIAPLLVELCNGSSDNLAVNPRAVSIIQEETLATRDGYFGCPDCGGVMIPLVQGRFVHFRCETGHMFSPLSLLAEQTKMVENGLWVAARALMEKARLSDQLATNLRASGYTISAERFERQAQDIREQADLIKAVIAQINHGTEPDG